MAKRIDVVVENCGTIFLFAPQNARAGKWLAEHVSDALYYGSALACEPRYARDLADGMQAAGLRLA